jgi:hypothetical protein
MAALWQVGVVHGAAAHRGRWVAGRSCVAWRGPGYKQPMSACPRPGVRRGPLWWSGGHPYRPLPPCVLVAAARARAGVRGRRRGPRLQPQGGWGWKHARAGAKAQAGGWCRSIATRSKVAAWSRWRLSCAMRGLASSALRGGFLRGPAAGRAAVSAVPQQGQAHDGMHRAAGRSSTAQWCHAPATPGPCAASGAMVHGLSDVAASCGEGGARGGGGRWSPGGPRTGVGLQPPNQGLQATAYSVRSFLAPAFSRA